MKRMLLVFPVFFLFFFFKINAQVEIGKPCPTFVLDHVTHYTKKQVTNEDFKGKWLFLDFWFTGCSSCITAMPKINELQNAFPGEIQFMMVGYNAKSYVTNIEEMFEKIRKKKGLNIASAYDSTLAKSWGIRSMPHIVVVDPAGIVRYVTDGRDMTKEKIGKLVSGGSVSFASKEIADYPQFNTDLKTADGNSFPNEKLLKQSIFTKWNVEKFDAGINVEEFITYPKEYFEQGFKLARVSLEWLYSIAYHGKPTGLLAFVGDSSYGKVYPKPIYETKDSISFQRDDADDEANLYNYFLKVPYQSDMTAERFMKFIQVDLEQALPYEAIVEEREMPVWKLVAGPSAKSRLRSKGGAQYNSIKAKQSAAAGFEMRNFPMKDLHLYLFYYVRGAKSYPFIDETGIDEDIDFKIEADLLDINDIKRELKNYGLDLVLSRRKMKVLIIRDKDKAEKASLKQKAF